MIMIMIMIGVMIMKKFSWITARTYLGTLEDRELEEKLFVILRMWTLTLKFKKGP